MGYRRSTGLVGLVSVALLAVGASCSGGGGSSGDAGGGSEGGPIRDGDPGGECSDDRECDDGVACTQDSCESSCGDPRACAGYCSNIPMVSLCGPGEACDVVRGCVPGMACARDRDCEDDDACTEYEYCDDSTRVCMWSPLDGDDDGDPPPVCGGTDCDDDAWEVHGGAPELCDGRDNDCDDEIDEGPDPDEDCGPGAVCRDGRCACADASLELCSDGCVDTQTDHDNCGGCYNTCPDEATCTLGECACPGTLEYCSFRCRDLATDPYNCGACGRVCSDGECMGGACHACGGVGEPCCAGSMCRAGICSAGSCVSCGGLDEPCCTGDSCTSGECVSGTCIIRACRMPLPPPPASIYPRCAASTLDCLAGCMGSTTCAEACYAADPTPPSGGLDCLDCVNITLYACLGADTCRTEWGDWQCCMEDHCPPPGDRTCATSMCGPEDRALSMCADTAPDTCFTEAARCFPSG